MLSRLSVKKPFTVLVGVVIVIILGFMSVTDMTSDLLPSMNLPYCVVYTVYPGANPEEVETAVTRPVESAMATVSNVEKMQSVSSENSSMVILQFADGSNMDSITIEMRESLDAVSSLWDDSISSPVIMNINPDMIPVMVSAVNVKGLSGAGLKDYIDGNLVNRLESIEGVAGVTLFGGIEEKVNITISQSKLSAKNDEIKNALEKKFEEAKKELSDAKSEINDGIDKVDAGSLQIENAKTQLGNQQKELSSQLNDAKAAADEKMTEILETKLELNSKLQSLLTEKESLTLAKEQLLAAVPPVGPVPDELAARLVEIDTALNSLDSSIETLQNTLSALNEGEIAARDAKKELEIQEASANYQLYTALAEAVGNGAALAGTKAQLQSGLKQIEEGEESLNSTIDSTYEKLDLNNIITRTFIGQILSAQNFSMPAGYVVDDAEDNVIVRIGNKFFNTDDMGDTVLFSTGLDDVEPIRLSDVADIEITDNSDSIYAKVNGSDGILLSFDKQTGYSTGDVADKLKDAFKALSEEFEDVSFTVLMDQGIYIDYVVSSVFKNLLWGALFAIVILVLFFRSFKPTLTIAVSIPVSLLFAVTAMYFSGVSINIISLSGLALAVGMLVDNSIVVIENIYRLRSEGVPIYKACVDGAKQVAGAIAASTITTCCVFIPIIFTKGLTRQLFVDLALTVTYSLCASLIIALTVVPALSSGLLKNISGKENRTFLRLQNLYGRSLSFFLKRKAIVIVTAVILLVASAFFAIKSGTSFMPSMDSNQVTVTVTPPEDADFKTAGILADTVAKRILSLDEVESVGAMAGSSTLSMSQSGDSDNSITVYTVLKSDRAVSNSEFKEKILAMTENIDCEVSVSSQMSDLSSVYGTGITVRVSGNDPDKLMEIAKDFAKKLEGVAGAENIDNGLGDVKDELRIVVDKQKASDHNLTVAGIYSQIRAKIGTAVSSTKLSLPEKDIDVFVYDGEALEYDSESIKAITVEATDNEGKKETVPLVDVASFEETESLSSIRRIDQQRVITIRADLKDGYNIGLVGNEVQKLINGYDISSGYTISLVGQNESINDALSQMMLMIILGIVLVYLVMVAQFQSLKMPFIIMFTIPLAFTGGFLALIVCGFDFSIVSMLGFIILAGVIVNNGIVLVDYINRLRLSGLEKREAIIQAGKTRLRPILMTAVTTVLGLIMTAFGVGIGADMVQPLAVVTIGGLVYGTLMTLWIVPVIYDIFSGKKELRKVDV